MAKRKMPKSQKMTLDKLALMMGRGFNAVDERFDSVDGRLVVLEADMKEVKVRLTKVEENIASLTGTLDAFLKRLTDHEEEMHIMKNEMKMIKQVLKEKLHVDIDRVHH